MKIHKECGGEIKEEYSFSLGVILCVCTKCGKVLTGCITNQIIEQLPTTTK